MTAAAADVESNNRPCGMQTRTSELSFTLGHPSSSAKEPSMSFLCGVDEAGPSGMNNKPFPGFQDLRDSIKELASLPHSSSDSSFPAPLSFVPACKKRKHPSSGTGSAWMSRSFTAATSTVLSNHSRTISAKDDIALLPKIRQRKRLSLASRTASSTSTNSSSLSHSSSLDRVALKRLQDSRRFKRKRSSSLSCIQAGSPTRLKQPFQEDLSRSVSFKASEVDGCRAFSPYDLDVRDLIGRGFFGEVFKVRHKSTGEMMVLKRLYKIDPKHERTFLKEAAVMRQLDHPNVLKFLGVLYKEKQLHLVTEWVSGGSLKTVLEDTSIPLPWYRRTAIAKDIAAGMTYLHSMNIIHRDLNSGNVLIRQECGSAVVSDFGLARLVSRRKASRRRRYTVVGNPYWMAPEMLKECNYDERVDVFSFGITLCEIIGRCTADPDVLPRTPDFGLHQEKFMHQFCAECPQPLLQIAFRCAATDPDLRPPFCEVHDWLELLKLELEDVEDSEAGLPVNPNLDILSREILLFPAPPRESCTPLRARARGKTALSSSSSSSSASHRRKISLDLGYGEETPSNSRIPVQSRCVSADPCCARDGVEEALSVPAPRWMAQDSSHNTLLSCSESALDGAENGGRKLPEPPDQWEEPFKSSRMDVDEEDSAISSHNSSGGSYFS